MLRPFENVLKAKLMLRWIAMDRHSELGHRARVRRTDIVFTEAGDGNRNGFVQALRVYVDAMENAVGVGEGDTAP